MLRRQVFGACAPAPGFALLPLVPDLLLPDSVPALTSTPSRALFVCVCVALSLSASAFFSCVRTQTPLANLKTRAEIFSHRRNLNHNQHGRNGWRAAVIPRRFHHPFAAPIRKFTLLKLKNYALPAASTLFLKLAEP